MNVTPQQKVAAVSALLGAMFGAAVGISFANLSEDDTMKLCSSLLAGDYDKAGKLRIADKLGFQRIRPGEVYCNHKFRR